MLMLDLYCYTKLLTVKGTVIILFIQMMWIYQPQHRIFLYNVKVSQSIKKLNTFVGPDGSSVYIKNLFI
jgi:hypothetical protein